MKLPIGWHVGVNGGDPGKMASPKMSVRRVLHIVPADGVGGVEIAARSMAERDDLACEFRLLFLSNKKVNQPTMRTLVSPGARPWSLTSIAWALRTIKMFAPDVLICSLWRSVPLALLAKGLLPQTKLVLFLHADRAVHQIDEALTRVGALAADEIWCDSNATLTHRIPFLKIGTKRRVISFVIRRGTLMPSSGHLGPRFVTWCRLTHQKAVDRSIELVRIMRRSHPDVTFEIWGPDGGSLSNLQQQARDLLVSEQVRFKGIATTDMLPRIAANNCFFLHPSRFEGMAVAVVEAMQMGLVPVVTPIGQMATYVRSGENGVVIDPDRLDAAAAEIAGIMADPTIYDRLREGARSQWCDAQLYADDVCAAARVLAAS